MGRTPENDGEKMGATVIKTIIKINKCKKNNMGHDKNWKDIFNLVISLILLCNKKIQI